MAKYDRFGLGTSATHGGYSAGPTVVQASRLDTIMPKFKEWFVSMDGFGEYLRNFYTTYGGYFDSHAEEHSLVYTQLHKEFSTKLDQSIVDWLHAEGLSEDDFGDMLRLARDRGDQKSNEIVAVLLGMLDYQLWIENIFRLKHNSQVSALLVGSSTVAVESQQYFSVALPEGVAAGQELQVQTPDGQMLTVLAPVGCVAGQAISVAYTPLSVATAAATTDAAAPPAGSAPTELRVAIPEGALPGQRFQVQAPAGNLVDVEVPVGVAPGDIIVVMA